MILEEGGGWIVSRASVHLVSLRQRRGHVTGTTGHKKARMKIQAHFILTETLYYKNKQINVTEKTNLTHRHEKIMAILSNAQTLSANELLKMRLRVKLLNYVVAMILKLKVVQGT